jgi:hypothetical protein
MSLKGHGEIHVPFAFVSALLDRRIFEPKTIDTSCQLFHNRAKFRLAASYEDMRISPLL